MEELINAYIFAGKPEGKRHSEDLSVDGRIIVKWILVNRVEGGLDSSGSE
jgi:hypothetical protein